MIRLLFLMLMSLPLAAPAATLVRMDEAQQAALGIRTAAPQAVTGAWGSPWPAMVRVPNAQLRVVSAPQEGLIEAMQVAAGERVEKGQLLALIQSPKLIEDQRAYLEALTALELARADLARDRELRKEGIISESRFLKTRARHTRARTEVAQRRQALLLAGMDEGTLEALERSRRLTARLEVRSPMAGTVLEQMATPGQRVDMATPLYRIARLDPLWLEIQVPLERLAGIEVGTPVRVENGLEGRVVTIGGRIHDHNQTVLVRAEVPNAGGALRPGQFLEVRLAQGGTGASWRVPRSALLRAKDGTWVMVARPGGFEPLRVEVVAEEPEAFVVRGALQATDRIAVGGTAALKAAWLEGGD